jgi:hypothetical protein
MATTTTIAPPIKLAALLRRSEAKKGLLFEVMLGHQVLTSRTSGSFDFVGCLVGRPRGMASTIPYALQVVGYFGKADALQAAVRKAERRVWQHGPLKGQGYYTELIIATVAGYEQQAAEFNLAHPVGTAMTYTDDLGYAHQVRVRTPAFAITNAALVSIEGATGRFFGSGGYTLSRMSPAQPADTGASVMAATLAVFFEVGAANNPTGWRLIRHFCDELAAAGQLEHLRRQLSDYIVVKALSGQAKHGWRVFINAGHDPMAGVWNQRSWAAERAAAEQAFVTRNPA